MGLLVLICFIFSGRLVNALLFIIRAVLVFTRPFSDKLLDVLHTIFMGKNKPLPTIENKILLMSATELSEKIRKRQISAADVMQIYIDRIRAVQPQLNAYVDDRFEDALVDAVKVDEMLKSGLKTEEELRLETPLLGVPFTCKEIVGVKGLAQTNGMLRFKTRKASEDSDAAAEYRRAGAIPVVVTNIPTMLLWWDTSNPVFGTTRNPFDKRRAVGGSSGGEASLISSAGAVIGIGSDLGGSIRLPCSFCGIYGHKPSQGIVSNKTPWSYTIETLDAYTSIGPMCRYVEDLHLLMRVLMGGNDGGIPFNEKVNFRKVKIYYMETLPGTLLAATPDVKAAVRKATKHFEEEFQTKATELKIEELKQGFLIWQCKAFDAAGPFLRTALSGESGKVNLLWEYFKCLFGCSEFDYRILFFTSIEIREKDKTFHDCLHKYSRIKSKLEELFDEDAILILPTQPEPPPHPITTIPKFFNLSYTAVFNFLGYPATQIPAGLSGGLPIGIQAVAGRNKDHLTLAAAVELDKVFGGWECPGPVAV